MTKVNEKQKAAHANEAREPEDADGSGGLSFDVRVAVREVVEYGQRLRFCQSQ